MFHYKGEKMAVASCNSDLHGHGEAIRAELGRRIPRGKKLKVLDVGTGFGINVAFLAGWLSRGSAVWTVDPSREVLADVKAALDEEGARLVRFAVATADDLDFEDGFFDYVVSVMVLHHIEKLQPALREMARVLKPGGTVVVVDYKPEASHELEFKSRHEEADFFEADAVAKGMGRLGMKGTPHDFGVWYLVEAKKERASAPRPAARAGRARARAGR
ncbi:MAG TPA: class I SAM-dependent methyltransferase [Nitrososphaerales archaeon]|nr:class I SAM-dependent methyltransferase [Nitrososphaerales archaeon]